MTTVIVAAQRGLDLFLRLDTGTGVILAVGTADEIGGNRHDTTLATLDGASDLLHLYGWRTDTVPVCGVNLPRPQLAALAAAYNNGDTRRVDNILRCAGRVTHTSAEGAA